MTRCLQIASLYNWDRRLCIGPDVSHTVQVSDCKAEGNGVGDFEAPPVSAEGDFPLVKDILALSEQSKVLISVNIKLADGVSFAWDTVLSNKNLFVQLPQTFLPSFSKERYASFNIPIFKNCCNYSMYAKILPKWSHFIITSKLLGMSR